MYDWEFISRIKYQETENMSKNNRDMITNEKNKRNTPASGYYFWLLFIWMFIPHKLKYFSIHPGDKTVSFNLKSS